MEQLAFFPECGQTKGLPIDVLEYIPNLFEASLGAALMEKFIKYTHWTQKIVNMYDKQVITPRLSAWFADQDTYDYTSIRKSAPNRWTPELLMIKRIVEPIAGVTFNSVLLNYYRDGKDSVAWHSDNEKALGTHPTIASVTFGQVRAFDIRNKADHSEKYSVRLEHGSLLLMKGDLQSKWEHRIAKSTRHMKPRNLTFRIVI
ncbi:alpha-ketoglutarate-dependent dioxygenase AlkB [Pedobacter frigidisoli]|uniref:Alpha-ketoglutarate-dependent dioxygenase AlkB n=1 Tax=Pedobacter frigidisoli TaxID=2530455 RepID=A0A4R0NYY7_9SPHI|nr:alpha-ketoglutarate-dependent dioxygenase AlkB [Pedobacter frigidisoli]TCD05878.1 alpha-ketoglutarate-dependent dioxygenase AlkB [Pedobacter frigidisoli]